MLKQCGRLVVKHGSPGGRISMQDKVLISDVGDLTMLVQRRREKLTDNARQMLEL